MKDYLKLVKKNYEIYVKVYAYTDGDTRLYGYINYIGKRGGRCGNSFIYDQHGYRFDFPESVPVYIRETLDKLYYEKNNS